MQPAISTDLQLKRTLAGRERVLHFHERRRVHLPVRRASRVPCDSVYFHCRSVPAFTPISAATRRRSVRYPASGNPLLPFGPALRFLGRSCPRDRSTLAICL